MRKIIAVIIILVILLFLMIIDMTFKPYQAGKSALTQK